MNSYLLKTKKVKTNKVISAINDQYKVKTNLTKILLTETKLII